MPIKIRLRRMGRKKQPHYRIVVAESLAPRDGRFLETVGFYDPLPQPARLAVNEERVAYWLGRGAIPTETVAQLLRKARKGGDEKVVVAATRPGTGRAPRENESLEVREEAGGKGPGDDATVGAETQPTPPTGAKGLPGEPRVS